MIGTIKKQLNLLDQEIVMLQINEKKLLVYPKHRKEYLGLKIRIGVHFKKK